MTIDEFIAEGRANHHDWVRREDPVTPRGEGTVEIWQLPSGGWAVSQMTRSSTRPEDHFATEQEVIDFLREKWC